MMGFTLVFYAKLGLAVLAVDALPGLFGSGRCIHDRLADTWGCVAKPEGRCRVLRG